MNKKDSILRSLWLILLTTLFVTLLPGFMSILEKSLIIDVWKQLHYDEHKARPDDVCEAMIKEQQWGFACVLMSRQAWFYPYSVNQPHHYLWYALLGKGRVWLNVRNIYYYWWLSTSRGEVRSDILHIIIFSGISGTVLGYHCSVMLNIITQIYQNMKWENININLYLFQCQFAEILILITTSSV